MNDIYYMKPIAFNTYAKKGEQPAKMFLIHLVPIANKTADLIENKFGDATEMFKEYNEKGLDGMTKDKQDAFKFANLTIAMIQIYLALRGDALPKDIEKMVRDRAQGKDKEATSTEGYSIEQGAPTPTGL